MICLSFVRRLVGRDLNYLDSELRMKKSTTWDVVLVISAL
jgi:hypothetical protein